MWSYALPESIDKENFEEKVIDLKDKPELRDHCMYHTTMRK